MSLCARNNFSLFLDETGSIWGCGANVDGQLGLPRYAGYINPTRMASVLPPIQAVSGGNNYSLLLDHSGLVWTCGGNKFGCMGVRDKTVRDPQIIPIAAKIAAISAGEYSTVLLDENGIVWSFGSNSVGQIGHGRSKKVSKPKVVSGLPKIEAISCGGCSTLYLDTEGGVWISGVNGLGKELNNVYKPCKLP